MVQQDGIHIVRAVRHQLGGGKAVTLGVQPCLLYTSKYAMQLENDYLYDEKTGLENLKIFGKYFGFEINAVSYTHLSPSLRKIGRTSFARFISTSAPKNACTGSIIRSLA